MAAKEIDLSQLPAFLTRTAANLERADNRPALNRCKLILVSETKQNFARSQTPSGAPWKPLVMARPRGGGKPLRDRGLLMASVTSQGKGHVEEITSNALVWGTNLDYAPLHQHGGTIVPKRAKALAIPLTREAYLAGSPRRFGRPLVMLWRQGASSGVLAERAPRGQRGKAHYLLKKSVTVPARPFLGWTEKMADKCNMIFAEFWEEQADG